MGVRACSVGSRRGRLRADKKKCANSGSAVLSPAAAATFDCRKYRVE